jgi:peptide/nickel transport system permease protein
MIPTLFIVSIVVFLVVRLIPGDAVDAIVAKMRVTGGGTVSVDREAVEHMLGLDVAVHVQYGRWLGLLPQEDGRYRGILQGHLGKSFWKPTTVAEEIANRWPVTFELGLLGLLIGQIIALPIGIHAALRQDTVSDYVARSFAVLAMAVPAFWLATMIVVFPGIWWGYMPPLQYVRFFEDPLSNLRMFVLPALVLGMTMGGGTMRLTRTMMLEVLRQDYIRTAWAKGLKEAVVTRRHALKNAMVAVVTLIGLWMPVLIGGTVVIEQIFVLPGMGRLLLLATQDRDYATISGVMLVFGVVLLFINLIVDLTYSFLDPRVRYS